LISKNPKMGGKKIGGGGQCFGAIKNGVGGVVI